MWYYIKQALLPILYLFFTAITAFGIMLIEGDNVVWVKVVLLLLNLALYLSIVIAASHKDGQEALKVRIANDLERVQIIRTGEALPLKLKEEYKPWKGFLTGAITCAPLIILLVIHTILIFAVGPKTVGAGAIAGFLYMMIFAFARCNVPPTAEGVAIVTDPYMYYWTLIAVPIILLATGIGYIVGAKKIELQQQKIKEKQRQIYGE